MYCTMGVRAREVRFWEMRWGCPRRRRRALAVNPAYFRDGRLPGSTSRLPSRASLGRPADRAQQLDYLQIRRAKLQVVLAKSKQREHLYASGNLGCQFGHIEKVSHQFSFALKTRHDIHCSRRPVDEARQVAVVGNDPEKKWDFFDPSRFHLLEDVLDDLGVFKLGCLLVDLPIAVVRCSPDDFPHGLVSCEAGVTPEDFRNPLPAPGNLKSLFEQAVF